MNLKNDTKTILERENRKKKKDKPSKIEKRYFLYKKKERNSIMAMMWLQKMDLPSCLKQLENWTKYINQPNYTNQCLFSDIGQ